MKPDKKPEIKSNSNPNGKPVMGNVKTVGAVSKPAYSSKKIGRK